MHARIEALLERWGHFVFHHAWWVIALSLALTGAAATQLKHFYIDASLEVFFREDAPVRVLYDEFRNQYGRDTFIIVALEPSGPIFEREFLERLRDLHERIESEVPLVIEHEVVVTGLTTETLYHFRVASVDSNALPSSSSDQIFITTG